MAEIKDFIRSFSQNIDVAEVREYLARGEDELILGHYDEANKFLEIGVSSIVKVRRRIDKKKIMGLITRAETASHKKFINDSDGRLQGMLEKSRELAENDELDKATEMAYEVLNRCSEESKYGEMLVSFKVISA